MEELYYDDDDQAICESFDEKLNLFVDGELRVADHAAMFNHLAECDRCRQYFDELLALRRMMGEEVIRVAPSQDEAFLRRLAQYRSAVQPSKVRNERRERMRRLSPVAGRALVGAAIVILVLTSLMPSPRTDAEITSLVVGEEELVNFTTTSSPNRDRGAVYVFYPGLTIEADNEVEPAPTEAL